MNANFARALTLVLAHESGFVNHPKDPGGATNNGITIATYRKWVKRNATVEDLKRITNAEVEKIYRKLYWDVVRGDDLPSGVDYAVFDYAVNSGPARSAKALQTIVGAKVDGIVGPETLAKTRAMGAADIVAKLCDERLAFLKRLNTWATFGKGWSSRVSMVREDALQIIAFANPQKPPPQPAPAPEPRKGLPWGWIALVIAGVLAGIAAFLPIIPV